MLVLWFPEGCHVLFGSPAVTKVSFAGFVFFKGWKFLSACYMSLEEEKDE